MPFSPTPRFSDRLCVSMYSSARHDFLNRRHLIQVKFAIPFYKCHSACRFRIGDDATSCDRQSHDGTLQKVIATSYTSQQMVVLYPTYYTGPMIKSDLIYLYGTV